MILQDNDMSWLQSLVDDGLFQGPVGREDRCLAFQMNFMPFFGRYFRRWRTQGVLHLTGGVVKEFVISLTQ